MGKSNSLGEGALSISLTVILHLGVRVHSAWERSDCGRVVQIFVGHFWGIVWALSCGDTVYSCSSAWELTEKGWFLRTIAG